MTSASLPNELPASPGTQPWHEGYRNGLPTTTASWNEPVETLFSHRTVRSYLPDRLFRTLPSRLRSPHLRGSFWSIPTAIARVIRRLHVGCRVRKEDSELSADNF
jgi:hypothetical protein